MKKERIKVLELLENGKITADEATKLLETLKGNNFDDYCSDWDPEDRFGHFAHQVDSFAKEFGDKVENAYREMEPKLKKASKTVVEKTVSIIDEISKSLNESLKKMEEESCCCCNNEQEADECNDDQPRENQ